MFFSYADSTSVEAVSTDTTTASAGAEAAVGQRNSVLNSPPASSRKVDVVKQSKKHDSPLLSRKKGKGKEKKEKNGRKSEKGVGEEEEGVRGGDEGAEGKTSVENTGITQSMKEDNGK